MHQVRNFVHITKIKKNARVFNISKRSFSNAEDKAKIEKIGKALNITDLNQWYSISNSSLQLLGLSENLLEKHANSPAQFFSSIYPEYDWVPWKFNKIPKNFWDDVSNHKKFLDWVAIQLKITKFEDWYNVTAKDIYDLGGSFLLNIKYNGSPQNLISSVYPEIQWLPWQFALVPKGYWDNIENQKLYIEWAGKQLGIKEMSDWYHVTQKQFYDLNGRGLLFKYGGSPSGTLKAVFPEYDWLPWKFTQCPKGFWEDIKNQKQFMDWVATQLNIKTMEDWYKITQKDIHDLGGGGLLNWKYKGSPVLLLSAVFPDFEWQPWKFANSPKYTWEDEKNVKGFFDWAGKQLGIKSINDWTLVSKKDIIALGGATLLSVTGNSMGKLLVQAFPNHKWKIPETAIYNKKSQAELSKHLRNMFPKEEMLSGYQHPDIVLTSGYPSELDIYFPNLKLAVEYQGQQHYEKLNFLHNTLSLEERKLIDEQKKELCKRSGITLLQIPYWWNREYSSIAMTLYRVRPDLFAYEPIGTPIPHSPTQKSVSTATKTKQFQFCLARNWEESQDPTGWLMSEKYDGMRLYWDGSKFITRQHTIVTAPEFITKALPSVPLDGELWTQYGLYQEAVALSQGNISEDKWKKVTYWVFDAPGLANEPFEERLAYLNSLENLPSFVKITENISCSGPEHLKQYFNDVLAKGGEGVMLRESGSLYQSGRCKSLRKYKQYFDAEVLVTENKYPQGFECKHTNGSTLFVPVNENYDEAKNVKPGTVITVKHSGTNVHGNYLFPKFFRARTDVKWDNVIKAK